MSDGQALLSEAIAAHGGIDRWSAARTISAHFQIRGFMPTVLFPGHPEDGYHFQATVHVQRRRAVLTGFPTPDLTCTWTPEEVRVERDGTTIARRVGARDAFAGWGSLRRFFSWDALDAAYFIGYALSNYLTQPYLLGRFGIIVRRGPDLHVDGEIWRRLQVTHPQGFDSHCREETFFIDPQVVIRRHEYIPDILPLARNLGRTPVRHVMIGSHFTSAHREFDGLVFPTFRRVVLARPAGAAIPGLPTLISARLTDITVSYATAGATSDACP